MTSAVAIADSCQLPVHVSNRAVAARMVQALAACDGVRNKAAVLIQMPLRTFVTKLKRFAIQASEWAPPAP